jgi:hypothetical protein
MILNRDNIQNAIIHAKTKFFFWLFNEYHKWNDMRATNSNEFFDQIFVQIATKLLDFDTTHIVQSLTRDLSVFFKIDDMIVRATRRQDLEFFLEENI